MKKVLLFRAKISEAGDEHEDILEPLTERGYDVVLSSVIKEAETKLLEGEYIALIVLWRYYFPADELVQFTKSAQKKYPRIRFIAISPRKDMRDLLLEQGFDDEIDAGYHPTVFNRALIKSVEKYQS